MNIPQKLNISKIVILAYEVKTLIRRLVGIRFSFLALNVTDSIALGHGFVPSASDAG